MKSSVSHIIVSITPQLPLGLTLIDKATIGSFSIKAFKLQGLLNC